MRRVLRTGGVVLAVALLVAQAVPVDRTNPPVESDVAAPPAVAAVLRRACYDCHSHETVWPWYSHVAPVSWLVAHDVHEARDELNFSAWQRYTPAKRRKKLDEIAEAVREGEMPLLAYRFVHGGARLSPDERALLAGWAEAPDGADGPASGARDSRSEPTANAISVAAAARNRVDGSGTESLSCAPGARPPTTRR